MVIKSEGVNWLYENYFRRDYLKELEEYKWKLGIKKIIWEISNEIF